MRTTLGLLVLAFTLCAQEDDTGVAQISGFLGGVFGIGTRPAGGAAFAFPNARYLAPYLEVGYASLGTYNYRTGVFDNTRNISNSSIFNFDGGVRVRFPNRTHTVPYLGLGLGLLRFSSEVASSGFAGNTDVTTSTNYLAGHVSGGLLFYITGHFGIQPEVRGYLGHNNFTRVTLGLFYQFP